MGRKRIPQALRTETSQRTKADMQTEALIDQEALKVERKAYQKPPAWLSKDAKAEYKRVIQILEPLNYLTDGDINNLVGYANAYAMYKRLSIVVDKEGAVVCTVDAKTGAERIMKNPNYTAWKEAADEVRRFGSQLGLTLDSRLKIAERKVKDTADAIEDEFGDI